MLKDLVFKTPKINRVGTEGMVSTVHEALQLHAEANHITIRERTLPCITSKDHVSTATPVSRFR
jgi:hypothetical protein